MEMTIEQINELQAQYGITKMQNTIDSGLVWKLEGSMGRQAMSLLESGACYLPEKDTQDYYGNLIPARTRLQAGTKGTLELSQEFWSKVEDGDIEIEMPCTEDFDDPEE